MKQYKFYYLLKNCMHITYHGLSCFKIIAKTEGRGSKDVTIIFAPYDKKLGLRPPQSNADIILIPHPDAMFNNPEILRGNPIIINRPGEYAVKGINIVGSDSLADHNNGESRGNTVVFSLDVEGMKIVYLGAIGTELSPDVLDTVVGADIVFLPIGDTDGIDAKTAEIIAKKIEAKLVIPMQYKTNGLKIKTLIDENDFCAEIGNCPKTKEDKLIIKKKDLENKSMDLVLLKVI